MHSTVNRDTGLAFRGYVLDPPLHSNSEPDALLTYWANRRRAEHNGVFSTAMIRKRGRELCLTVDAFGLSPLYYRIVKGIVLFATNPRFLTTEGDESDLIAWRSLLEGGFILGNRSLTAGVTRVAPGQTVVWADNHVERRSWFDFATLPRGERQVDKNAVSKVESMFVESMDRCMRLNDGPSFLPLSSGHDSRRILAGLLDREAEFTSATVRVFQKGYRDLDATYAAQIAADYDFDHRIIEAAPVNEYVVDDFQRRVLTDSETPMHSWVPRMVRALPPANVLVWDGILGDILGNPGFRLPQLYLSPQEDAEIISRVVFPGAFDSVLAADAWPSNAQLQEEVIQFLKGFPAHRNIAELAFITLRQRRATAPWSHQLLPVGYVPVCPYADLEYIRLLLEYDPADKHKTVFQRRCLEVFWPKLSQYPGNRDIPANARRGDTRAKRRIENLLLERLFDEVLLAGEPSIFRRQLSSKGKSVFALSRFAKIFGARWYWAVQPLLELASRQLNNKTCWTVKDTA